MKRRRTLASRSPIEIEKYLFLIVNRRIQSLPAGAVFGWGVKVDADKKLSAGAEIRLAADNDVRAAIAHAGSLIGELLALGAPIRTAFLVFELPGGRRSCLLKLPETKALGRAVCGQTPRLRPALDVFLAAHLPLRDAAPLFNSHFGT